MIDLRPEEEYKRGSFPGAVNLPMEEFDSRYEEVLEKEKPIYFICHTGERSKDYIETATKAGYNAFNVEGGYRAYLRLSFKSFSGRRYKRKQRRKDKRN